MPSLIETSYINESYVVIVLIWKVACPVHEWTKVMTSFEALAENFVKDYATINLSEDTSMH